ncbi:MAG: FG-GAP-like repeat-containing protein [Candidatus Latescibacterota bacterium]
MTTRQVGIVAGAALVLCTPAAGQTFFVDVTDSAFVASPLVGRSAAWGDYDNDGWVDLLATEDFETGRGEAVILLHNQGNGRFANDAPTALPTDLGQGIRGGGSIFGDYDNDGDLDLYVPVGWLNWPWRGLPVLLRNDRGLFTIVSRQSGLTDTLGADNAIWLDYDRDGHLDLYTGNQRYLHPAVRNRLYRNRGDGTFTDVTAAAGLDVQLSAESGGSNGGMAAADLNDDGWPDLYLGVFADRNRLFLSDGQGSFRDATTDEIDDPGLAYDVTVGDVDNDGDVDVFQAAGGMLGSLFSRSLLLLNLGGGHLVDGTETTGLGGAVAETEMWNARFADLDNDGDLDLLTGAPHRLYHNDGTGFFTEVTGRSGIAGNLGNPALGDYDRDGALDAYFAKTVDFPGFGRLYRNRGNPNHWLEIELVGVQSNRSGIGARVIATAGTLRQVREVLGGLGFRQDEVMVHFGLGQRTRVDRLEIRWPAGQVDVLRDVPTDQRIRVVEGEPEYWAVQPFRAEWADTLVVGSPAEFRLRVQPARFDAEARITRVVADLSAAGGPKEVALGTGGGDLYALDASLPAPTTNGLQPVSVLVEQDTRLGPQWSRLTRSVFVMPATDLVIYDEALAPGWEVVQGRGSAELDLGAARPVQAGSHAAAVRAETRGWTAELQTGSAVSALGYRLLRFAFHPGDAVLPTRRPVFSVRAGDRVAVDLLAGNRIDFARAAWQEVEVPLRELGWPESVQFLGFTGTSIGTFYLDDIRLVAERPSRPVTAVLEAQAAAVPQTLALQPNYPNPFNSSTVIGFSLPERARVELAVYNLAGQRVVTLVQGERHAGTHTVTWDGRDVAGRPLASGVYVCRLWNGAGGEVERRKVVMVR